jgi:hypothetical protein
MDLRSLRSSLTRAPRTRRTISSRRSWLKTFATGYGRGSPSLNARLLKPTYRDEAIRKSRATWGDPSKRSITACSIAPYESDPRKWEKLPWIDEYSEERYRISASITNATRSLARVKSYGDVLEEYEFHEEAKCADATGEPCGRQSVGLLGRRHIRIEKLHFIGKESNKLEEVEEQSISDAADVYTEYPDPRRDGWETKILPFLRRAPAQVIIDATGISRRTVQRIRNEQTKPTAEHRRLLEAFAKGGKRDL